MTNSIYAVEIDRDLSKDKRTELKTKLVNNGFEFYARFADRDTAVKFAEKIKKMTGVIMQINEIYKSSISL